MLLRAVVQVPLELLPRLVSGGDDPRTRPPQLLGLPRPFGDVGAADEEEPAGRDLRQRRARPGDVDDLAGARQPPAVALARSTAVDHLLDRRSHLVRILARDVALPERHAADLVGGVAECVL